MALSEAPQGSFELLTSLSYSPVTGWHLLPQHLARLRAAHSTFSITSPLCWCSTVPFPEETKIQKELDRCVSIGGLDQPQRVRLVLQENGNPEATSASLHPMPSYPVRLVWAKEATDYTSPFLRYKTTKREIYDAARARCGATLRPSADPFEPPFDVLMYNLDGQVTETSISNCAFCLDRRLSSAFVTPAAACGLLPGIQRQALLDQGQIEEGIVTRAELQHAVEAATLEIMCFNAVRGVFTACLR